MLGAAPCQCVCVCVNSWYKACVPAHTGTAGWISTPLPKALWGTVVLQSSELFNSSSFSALRQLFPGFVSSLWFPPPAAWEPTWALSQMFNIYQSVVWLWRAVRVPDIYTSTLQQDIHIRNMWKCTLACYTLKMHTWIHVTWICGKLYVLHVKK